MGAGKQDEVLKLRAELKEAIALINSLKSGKNSADAQELINLRMQLKEAKESIKNQRAQVTELRDELEENTGKSRPVTPPPTRASNSRSRSPVRRSVKKTEDPQVSRMLERASGG